MADSEKKKAAQSRIDEDRRFKYIGFEVYPGKPKDLFKSAAEKDKLVEAVKAKRESGEVIRDECTLMEERVSGSDRIFMSLACVVMLFSLFLPWFSVYNQIEQKTTAADHSEPIAAVADSGAAVTDSMAALGTDSLAMAAATSEEPATTGEEPVVGEEVPPADELADAATDSLDAAAAVEAQGSSNEEVLHGYVAKKKYTKVYESVGGLGSLASLGSVGSYVFSSGFILVVTGFLMILMVLMTLGLPLYTLYGLYGLKGTSDQKALGLKKIVRLNWLPLMTFVLVLVISFLGAEYGFDAATAFSSLGDSYGVGVFMNTLSWGVFVSIAMSILLAAKGIEI